MEKDMVLDANQTMEQEEAILFNYLPEDLKVEDDVTENVRRAVEAVIKIYELVNPQVSITFTDNEHIHAINRDYRGIDSPTDVISFALNEQLDEEPEVAEEAPVDVLGDIIISLKRAEEQAEEYGHSFAREVAFLTVHGMLHLLGYDHMEEEERREMRREEDYVMEYLGISR